MGKQGIDMLGGSLLVEGGGTINACLDNSSNNYITLNAPITVTDGDTLNMYLSRYTYMMSPLSGSGVVNIYAGGERVYLANEKAKEYPNWDRFSGTVNIYKYTDVNASAGYYGVILGSGTTFNPSSVEEMSPMCSMICTLRMNSMHCWASDPSCRAAEVEAMNSLSSSPLTAGTMVSAPMA